MSCPTLSPASGLPCVPFIQDNSAGLVVEGRCVAHIPSAMRLTVLKGNQECPERRPHGDAPPSPTPSSHLPLGAHVAYSVASLVTQPGRRHVPVPVHD